LDIFGFYPDQNQGGLKILLIYLQPDLVSFEPLAQVAVAVLSKLIFIR
jgi:hypothetical protein